MSRPLTVVESPYAGDVPTNLAYLRRCMRDSLDRGEAPFASHRMYPGLWSEDGEPVDDDVEEHRLAGMESGFDWGDRADRVAVYLDRGLSTGMRDGIDRARSRGQPVHYRCLGWGQLPGRPGELVEEEGEWRVLEDRRSDLPPPTLASPSPSDQTDHRGTRVRGESERREDLLETWKRTVLETLAIPDEPSGTLFQARVETGPIRFGTDWPGVFLRGKHAHEYGAHLEYLLANPDKLEQFPVRAVLTGLVSALQSANIAKLNPETPITDAVPGSALRVRPSSFRVSKRGG